MSDTGKKDDFLKNFRDLVRDTTGIVVTDEAIMQIIFMHELTRLPGKKDMPNHWASKNPGAADQYRCEARAARSALGFGKDDPDVSPRDLRLAVEALKASNGTPDQTLNQAQDTLEVGGDRGIDLARLAEDIDYWNEVAPDEKATHYCTESKGFEYLNEGDTCDIPKPVTALEQTEIQRLRSSVRRLKAFVINNHGADAKVLQDVNKRLTPGE